MSKLVSVCIATHRINAHVSPSPCRFACDRPLQQSRARRATTVGATTGPRAGTRPGTDNVEDGMLDGDSVQFDVFCARAPAIICVYWCNFVRARVKPAACLPPQWLRFALPPATAALTADR